MAGLQNAESRMPRCMVLAGHGRHLQGHLEDRGLDDEKLVAAGCVFTCLLAMLSRKLQENYALDRGCERQACSQKNTTTARCSASGPQLSPSPSIGASETHSTAQSKGVLSCKCSSQRCISKLQVTYNTIRALTRRRRLFGP